MQLGIDLLLHVYASFGLKLAQLFFLRSILPAVVFHLAAEKHKKKAGKKTGRRYQQKKAKHTVHMKCKAL